MKEKDKKLLLRYIIEFLIILLLAFILYFINFYNKTRVEKLSLFSRITDSGKLRAVIVDYDDSKGYPGPPQDYFRDISEFLASRLWSRLELTHVDSVEEAEKIILEKKADLFIRTNPLNITKRLRSSLPYISATWNLIVSRDNLKVNKISDMKSGKLVVMSNNPFIPILRELEKSNGFRLIVDNKISLKEIFAKIETGEIDATISDNLTARAMRYFHPRAVTADKIHHKTELSFGLHPQAHDLRFRVNIFLKNICREDFINLLGAHYFHKIDVFEYLDLRKFKRRIDKRLPRYLDTIKKYSKEYKIDWRLVAAQIYQESHYNKWARSHASAKGLMQLMPSTASSLGVSNIYSPEENIKAGIIHLSKLYDIYNKANNQDRIKIALATYNMGQGHMYDARNISRDLGLNPDKWYNMLRVLPLLKKKKYYSKAVYGYARGDEPVNYVRKITGFYRVLKTVFPEDPFSEEKESSDKNTSGKKD